MNSEIENFKEIYSERVATIDTRKNLLIDSINQYEEYLNPLEVLSEFTKSCVNKYRGLVPSTAVTKSSIDSCISAATLQTNSMVLNPSNTMRNLQNYYDSTFERKLTACNQTYRHLPLNHSMCAIKEVN